MGPCRGAMLHDNAIWGHRGEPQTGPGGAMTQPGPALGPPPPPFLPPPRLLLLLYDTGWGVWARPGSTAWGLELPRHPHPHGTVGWGGEGV